MPAWAIIAIVIGCVLAAAAVAAGRGLSVVAARRRFGPEYGLLARQVGPRGARAELSRRQRRVAGLGIRPLTPEQRARYSAEWDAAQERFVEDPPQAVAAAGRLITAVAADRGYPAGNPGQLLADLSVSHARRLDGYRRAEQTARQAGTAPTEDLRQALLRYRALFHELMESRDQVRAARWTGTRRISRLRKPRWLRPGAPGQRQPRRLAPGQPPR